MRDGSRAGWTDRFTELRRLRRWDNFLKVPIEDLRNFAGRDAAVASFAGHEEIGTGFAALHAAGFFDRDLVGQAAIAQGILESGSDFAPPSLATVGLATHQDTGRFGRCGSWRTSDSRDTVQTLLMTGRGGRDGVGFVLDKAFLEIDFALSFDINPNTGTQGLWQAKPLLFGNLDQKFAVRSWQPQIFGLVTDQKSDETTAEGEFGDVL